MSCHPGGDWHPAWRGGWPYVQYVLFRGPVFRAVFPRLYFLKTNDCLCLFTKYLRLPQKVTQVLTWNVHSGVPLVAKHVNSVWSSKTHETCLSLPCRSEQTAHIGAWACHLTPGDRRVNFGFLFKGNNLKVFSSVCLEQISCSAHGTGTVLFKAYFFKKIKRMLVNMPDMDGMGATWGPSSTAFHN